MISREVVKGILKLFGVFGIIVSIGLYVFVIFLIFDPVLAAKLTGISILLGIIGAILFIAGNTIRETISNYICGYCNFVAKTERELYNHSLTCEKKNQETSKNNSQKSNSLDIIKERYAKGEITKEGFENMKKDLENS